jgi:predicted transcriptional regulator
MARYGTVWFVMQKVTFTLDDETVSRLRRTAARLSRPQSYVVREAIREYDARSGKLSEEERARLLAVVDRMVQEPPTRPTADVEAELRDIRSSRRRWTRRGARRRA